MESATEGSPSVTSPPVAQPRPVTNTYHGVEVVDPYQWLEADTEEVKAWADGQNAYARAYLDALPVLPAVTAEVDAIVRDPSKSYGSARFAGGRLFVLRRAPPKEQRELVVFDDAAALTGERVVLDPTALDDGGLLRIEWYEPSPDGSLVAVSLSHSGSERGDLSIYDVASGAALPDTIEYVQNGTAGGGVTWTADGEGLFYTRYPRRGERPEGEREFYQQLWYHALGSPASDDRRELGDELPRIAEIATALNPGTGELLATVQNGDGGEMAHFLRATDGRWTQLSEFGDGIKAILFTPQGGLIILSRDGALRGKLLALPPGERDMASAKVIVPEAADSIDWGFWDAGGLRVTHSRIYVVYQTGGPTALRVFDHAGKRLVDPPQPAIGAVGPVIPLAGDDVMYGASSFIEAPSWYRLSAADGAATRLAAISQPQRVDFSDAEVVRELATSADGTQVPVTIILRNDHPRDGSRPCVVSGYGGYGLSVEAGYRPLVRPFLDRGVCFAYANLRGGGEFGDAWHRAGMLTNKQNVFDDFAAVLRHMVARGYTSHDRLGIIGGSNGGLLMGATFTQHPELVRVVVSAVGFYDSLRTELSPNGEFNIPEFGTVTDEAQFHALYAYSPYHRVKDGTAYPAILMTQGDNDPRVEPWQSRKMAARLQAATSSDQPILLRTSAASGHGAGNLSEWVAVIAHQYAFLLHQLGAGS